MDMFYESVLNQVLLSMKRFSDRNAFCINEVFYTYQQFSQCISEIRHMLIKAHPSNSKVGLVVNDDLETYASIIALWLEGCCYVPLHPNWPQERCIEICNQVGLDLILDSSDHSRYNSISVLRSLHRVQIVDCLMPKIGVSDEELAYILFTSGSTGKPKGVQLSRKNLASFMDAFFDIYPMNESDRCLQCFDLTFDLSIMSYLAPLMRGACVYTVPPDEIKYTYVGSLIEDEQLTFALMAPSTIKYLRPYFDEMDCSSLKYSLFCGEALHEDITKQWSECAKNAIIDNVYGPTEDTIFCSTYRFKKGVDNKSHNGVLSIGKPMKNCGMEIFDDQCNKCNIGVMGELCLSGPQLTMGYYRNEIKNKEAFFEKDGIRWYHSGDVCYKDADGDIMYSGRLDHQAKIQGFRVELGEIEFHAKQYLKDKNVVCVAFDNKDGLTEIAMFIEKEEFNPDEMLAYMRTKMPSYMIPTRLFYIPVFPLNSNDKTDKVKLRQMIDN